MQKVLSKQEAILTYFTPNEHLDLLKKDVFSKYHLIREIKSKKKIEVKLDGNKSENEKKIALIRYEAQKLKYTNIKSTVIIITLTNDVSYGEFVSLLNICEMDRHRRFAGFDDKFVIFENTSPKQITDQTRPV
ncbi:MAG: hypothetical protein QM764_11950 [Chitinophagaceae bacterium]